MRRLQQHLVDIECLPESVLSDTDSMTRPTREGVATAGNDPGRFGEVAAVLANREQALPWVRAEFQDAPTEARRIYYATMLAIMGNDTGVPTLITGLERNQSWDDGWNFQAMGQFGSDMSRLDSMVVALGYAGDRKATAAIVAKTELLQASSDFSHCRAVALALERLADPAAAPALAALLAKPGMTGHALTSIREARQSHVDLDRSLTALEPRRRSLRELLLARALYRCGDHEGMGETILRGYTRDLRGH